MDSTSCGRACADGLILAHVLDRFYDFGTGAEAKEGPSGGAEKGPCGGAEKRPSGGAEKRPSGGAEKRPSGGAEKGPSGGADKRPCGGAEKRPSGGAEKRPSGGADKRPSGGADKRPCGGAPVQEPCVTAHHRKQITREQAGLKGPSSQNQVDVVVFQDPRKKRKRRETAAPPTVAKAEPTQSQQTEELDLEKARLEVHRFGITGFKKEQQRVFERDRAVMLGARPPRRQCVNYKILQQRAREQKEKAKDDAQPNLKKKRKNEKDRKSSTRDRKSSTRDRKSSSSGSGAAPSGQMGRFKNGVLILSSGEIQKIKGRK